MVGSARIDLHHHGRFLLLPLVGELEQLKEAQGILFVVGDTLFVDLNRHLFGLLCAFGGSGVCLCWLAGRDALSWVCCWARECVGSGEQIQRNKPNACMYEAALSNHEIVLSSLLLEMMLGELAWGKAGHVRRNRILHVYTRLSA